MITTFFNNFKILLRFLSALWIEFILRLLKMGTNPNLRIIMFKIANLINLKTSEKTERILQSQIRMLYITRISKVFVTVKNVSQKFR